VFEHTGMAQATEAAGSLPAGAREMASACRVQARLLAGGGPQLATLECAGVSLPAGGVGGDFYDFIKLSPRRVALVLGDISGKGLPAALMMASLQASVRSHYALGAGALPERLGSINRLFFESTAPGDFATLFLGEYDDRTRRLRYANCGHLPPLLLRGDGSLERLEPTATVLGIDEAWSCGISEARLADGDTLLLYTDGASEARSAAGEEFGEERLGEALRAARRQGLSTLLGRVVTEVREWSGGRLADDLTLVAARPRPGAAPMRLAGTRGGRGGTASG
jgi:serine phosphatase RsbU (regulator of sigma subunit)